MRKIGNKLLSFILSGLFLFGLIPKVTTPVFADYTTADNSELVAEKTANMLANCSPNFEVMGLTDLDLTNLYISSAIPAYEFVNGTLEMLEVEYYPILEDGQVVALSLKYEVEDEILTQITSCLAEEINNFISSYSKIALVFDNSSVYASDGITLIKIANFQHETSNREHLSFDARSVNGVQLEQLLPNIEYGTPSELMKLDCDTAPLDYPVDRLLSVPFYQNVDIDGGICIHCCISSIAKYLLNDFTFTPTDLYDMHGSIGGHSGIINILKKYTGYTYKGTNYGGGYFAKVCDSIYAGFPCTAALSPADYSYTHAVVLAGYYTNSSTNVAYVMDPNHNKYQMANVTSSGSLTYVRPDGGDILSFMYGIYY